MTGVNDLATPDDIETQLDSNWETGVIAKPSFKEAFLGAKIVDPNEVLIGWSSVELVRSTLGLDTDDMKNEFEIACVANSRANAIKLFSQVRKHLNAKSVTSGHWHVDRAIPGYYSKKHVFLVIMTETLHLRAD